MCGLLDGGTTSKDAEDQVPGQRMLYLVGKENPGHETGLTDADVGHANLILRTASSSSHFPLFGFLMHSIPRF